MMYAFAQRSDTKVIDEPFYACYLEKTGKEHPGRDKVLKYQSSDSQKVIDKILSDDYDEQVLFIKNMAHHMALWTRSFYDRLTNIFLIRDPAEMLTSLIKTIPNPSLRDTAYKEQYDIFRYVTHQLDQEPIVVDSKQLLLNPEEVLKKTCEKAGIPFEQTMLHWQKGPIPEDGVWAKHWYDNVHRSTGFKAYKPKDEEVPDRLKPLLKECYKYYNELYQHSIKAERS